MGEEAAAVDSPGEDDAVSARDIPEADDAAAAIDVPEAGDSAASVSLSETGDEAAAVTSLEVEILLEAARDASSGAGEKLESRDGKPRIAAPAATNGHVRKSMQGNKNKDTKPELVMRARLRAAGLTGYRLQWKAPGRPDIAWPGKRVCIQVMGCFWHRCPHCRPSTPKSHVEYWHVKFERNVERDERTLAQLRKEGWAVHVVWECQLKKKTIDETLRELFPLLSQELGKPLADGWDS